MRYIHKFSRVSKSLASSKNRTGPNRDSTHAAFASQIKPVDNPKTFPEDAGAGVFSEHPLIFDTHKMVSTYFPTPLT